jgi:hypothetical protein
VVAIKKCLDIIGVIAGAFTRYVVGFSQCPSHTRAHATY